MGAMTAQNDKKNSIIVIFPMILQKFENNLNPSLAIFFFLMFSFGWIYNTIGVAGVMHKLYLFIAKLLKTATAHNSPIIYRRFDF